MIYSIEEIRELVIPIAIKYELKAVYLFGSYARGTATASSDIDLIVDTTGTSLTSLMRLGTLYSDLQDCFDKEIDLITLSSLEQKPIRNSDITFKAEVEKERINLYATA